MSARIVLDVKWLGRADLLAFLVEVHNDTERTIPAGARILIDTASGKPYTACAVDAPIPPGTIWKTGFQDFITSEDFELHYTARWADAEPR